MSPRTRTGHRTIALPCLALAALLAPGPTSDLQAQTGPFQDNEIIVRVCTSGVSDIYRIDPTTGVGATLIEDVAWQGTSGTMVYDPWRRGLLCPQYLWGEGLSNRDLYVVDANGLTTPIVSVQDDWIRAIAPVGDGRVYYQPWSASPPYEIHYLDAFDNVNTLLDATGSAPFERAVEMMVYHAPSNALIATTSSTWTGDACTPGAPASVFRIPLSPDGTRVSGPMTCTAVGFSTANILGIDDLPNGDLLLTLEDNSWSTARLVAIDPVTLASSIWANEDVADLNGGFYSNALGAAIILDNVADVLRVVQQGSAGLPPELPVTVPVGTSTSGFGPGETMTEIDTLAAPCGGIIQIYGSRLAGNCSAEPRLSAYGCPDVNSQFTMVVSEGRGSAFGYLFLGFGATSVPFKGGQFLIGSLVASLPITLTAGSACAGGTLSFPVVWDNPAFSGVDIYFQAGFVDSQAIQGVSLTNGLQVRAG